MYFKAVQMSAIVQGDKCHPNDACGIHRKTNMFSLVEILWNLTNINFSIYYY